MPCTFKPAGNFFIPIISCQTLTALGIPLLLNFYNWVFYVILNARFSLHFTLIEPDSVHQYIRLQCVCVWRLAPNIQWCALENQQSLFYVVKWQFTSKTGFSWFSNAHHCDREIMKVIQNRYKWKLIHTNYKFLNFIDSIFAKKSYDSHISSLVVIKTLLCLFPLSCAR